jgi:hypothetical protein
VKGVPTRDDAYGRLTGGTDRERRVSTLLVVP